MKSIQLINGKDSPLNELYADQVVGDIREAKQISDQASNFAKLYDLKQHVDNDGFWRLYHIANQEDLRPTLARLSLDKFKLYVDVSAVEHENVSFYEEFVQVLQGEASPELDRHVRAVEKAKLTDTGDMYVNMGVEDYDQIGPEKLREAKKIWDNFMFRGHDEASCAEEEPLFFEAVTSYVRGDDRRFREYEIAHRIYGELEEDCKDFWVEIFKGGDVSGDDEILKLSISDITKANQAYKLAEDSFQRGLFWDNFYKVVDNGTIQQWSDSIIQRFSEIKEEDAIGGDTYREVFNGS